MALGKVADAKELFSEMLPPVLRERLPEGVSPSLYAIIKLSDDRLSPEAQAALRTLAVFPPKVNTFSFEAGRAVSGSAEALDILREYGLAEVVDPDNERYTMHMAIWEYARETLTDQSAYRRMAEYFIDYIQREREAGRSKTALFDGLEQEQANLTAALQWLVDNGEVQVGLRLAGALWEFWYERSRFAEGRSWIEKLLGLPGSDAPELVRERAEVLNDAGNFAYNQADLSTAGKMHNESLQLRKEISDKQAVAGSLNNLGLLDRERGDYNTAAARFGEALRINRELGNHRWAAINLNNLGVVAIRKGDGPAAQRLEEDSLALFETLGDDWGRAMALSDLGAALLLQGRRTAATDCYRRSLRLQWQIKNPRGLAGALRGLAAIAVADGDRQRATIQFRAALGQSLEIGDQAGIADALEGLVAVEPDDEDGPRAPQASWPPPTRSGAGAASPWRRRPRPRASGSWPGPRRRSKPSAGGIPGRRAKPRRSRMSPNRRWATRPRWPSTSSPSAWRRPRRDGRRTVHHPGVDGAREHRRGPARGSHRRVAELATAAAD
jgi:tetratricopeptide (TPR) repeat protein